MNNLCPFCKYKIGYIKKFFLYDTKYYRNCPICNKKIRIKRIGTKWSLIISIFIIINIIFNIKYNLKIIRVITIILWCIIFSIIKILLPFTLKDDQ